MSSFTPIHVRYPDLKAATNHANSLLALGYDVRPVEPVTEDGKQYWEVRANPTARSVRNESNRNRKKHA